MRSVAVSSVTRAADQRGELARVGEAQGVRAGRDVGVEVARRRGRAGRGCDLVLRSPHRQRDAAGDAGELGRGALRMREVVDDERAERDVERAVGERQRLGVAVRRTRSSGWRRRASASMPGGEVDAGDSAPRAAAAAASVPSPQPTSSTRTPGPTPRGVEQRLDANAVARAISAS